MSEYNHTVLCVDDERNILNSLKRLLRREDYCFLTASSSVEGLEILKETNVHLVISDQKMPDMTGIEFLSLVKERYPDIVRVILTGYTDVGLIAESVNKGHVYKFLLKPWDDQTLKLEIKNALDYYDLLHANRSLHKKILEQNEELKTTNENLEELVRKRTENLKIQNRVLELSRAILEDIPVPIIGVSAEGIIAFINRKTEVLSLSGRHIEVGRELNECLPADLAEKVTMNLTSGQPQTFKGYEMGNNVYDIDLTPLAGKFLGKGLIATLMPHAARTGQRAMSNED